jgi:hypothetical protein
MMEAARTPETSVNFFTLMTEAASTSETSINFFALMREAASTFETLVNFYWTTWHNIPEDCHFILSAMRT